MPNSPWGHKVAYHFEKVIEHLRKVIEHVPSSMGFEVDDPDGASKDDALGTAANVEMQVRAFLDRFRKVPEPKEDSGVKEKVAVGREGAQPESSAGREVTG